MKKIILGVILGLLISMVPIAQINQAKEALRIDNEIYQAQIEQMTTINAEYIPVKMTVTGYAPLDPGAIEGMCYSGDPNVTASGSKSDPNRTIAAGSGMPFGTQIYIPGIGNRIVEDRGSAITDNHIDIMFLTQKEALEWGRQEITVFVKR